MSESSTFSVIPLVAMLLPWVSLVAILAMPKKAKQLRLWICFLGTLAALSVVGIPPTAGFISKWYLILGNIEGGNYLYVVILLAGSVLAAVYCFRVIIYMFFLPGKEGAWEEEFKDAAPSMLSPVWILSLGTLFFGVFSYLLIPSLLKAAEFLL